MIKQCLICKKEFSCEGHKIKQKYCSKQCNDLAYYYRHQKERQDYQKKYHYKNFERDKEKKKNWFKKWYEKNKERQKENVKKDYKKNKQKWKERKYVNMHREDILSYLDPHCAFCGKEEIKEIHHITYDNLPKVNLQEYVKNLLGFCSKQCHINYERMLLPPQKT